MTLTQAGASGFIRISEDSIYFEPGTNYWNEGPSGWTVIYEPEHIISGGGSFLNDTHPSQREDVDPTSISNISISMTNGLVPDKYSQLNGDSHFYENYTSCWWCKMDDVMTLVSDAFYTEFGWSVYASSRQTCTTRACDQANGMNSHSPSSLLHSFSRDKQDDYYVRGERGWDMAFLFTGKDLMGTTIGAADLAGRYAMTQMVNELQFDGGTINYEGAVQTVHEMGHNFYGVHELAETTTHWHGLAPFEHHTVMYSPYSHEPSQWHEQLTDFAIGNHNRIDACVEALAGWDGLDYYAGNHDCP